MGLRDHHGSSNCARFNGNGQYYKATATFGPCGAQKIRQNNCHRRQAIPPSLSAKPTAAHRPSRVTATDVAARGSAVLDTAVMPTPPKRKHDCTAMSKMRAQYLQHPTELPRAAPTNKRLTLILPHNNHDGKRCAPQGRRRPQSSPRPAMRQQQLACARNRPPRPQVQPLQRAPNRHDMMPMHFSLIDNKRDDGKAYRARQPHSIGGSAP